MEKSKLNKPTQSEKSEDVKEIEDNSQREIQSIMISDGVYKSVYKDTGKDVV